MGEGCCLVYGEADFVFLLIVESLDLSIVPGTQQQIDLLNKSIYK
jgi:hypothetical protein